ncbi:CGNR zinc finger domain-containing protein [Streptomonospora sp. PA3]|uniref:CGNR zinc finger domain-containing protein n=1 Tax=Streptomonospora sp. PA3 TaxID=2607326 RepID=UPI0012DEAFC0|nr:CGNR zinc finger domain-containing protein [Streptomonospora sp. PA3]MUL40621.1 CGNR zinc finger domain-containing protein [Streptomonospora sp. PA3]
MVDARPPAPGGLELVEALCNTAELLRGRDALGDAAAARAWMRERRLPGADAPRDPGEEDLERLRRLREAVRDHLEAHSARAADARAHLSSEARRLLGPPRWSPGSDTARLAPEGGAGADGVAAAVLAALAAAELAGARARLKVCAAPECRWVFYDRSPANSGSWCSMAVCGARHKMRSYRSRRNEPGSAS